MRRALSYLQHRFAHRALVLMYHRVAELSSDTFLLSVSPQHFAEHLENINRYAQPMSLQALVASLQYGKLPRRAVTITFDDGYADNLHNAKPILEQYGIPATVFITAGQIGSQHEFWWDELERLIMLPGTLPDSLSLRVNDSFYYWEAGQKVFIEEKDELRDKSWHIERPVDPGPRQVLFRELYRFLHSLTTSERSEAMSELQAWTGATPDGRSNYRALSAEEVGRLAKGELIEVGAHTMTHPSLAALPFTEQCIEIQESKSRLTEILNRPVQSIAYPHGSYSKETLEIVRDTNFSCACSSNTDAVWRGVDLFQLPRIGVRDWDGEEFTRWLKQWLGK